MLDPFSSVFTSFLGFALLRQKCLCPRFREYSWNFPLRFQALEDEFAYQLEEQERHYGHYLTAALGDVDGAASVASGAAAAAASAGGSRR